MDTNTESSKQPASKGKTVALASLVLGILDALFFLGIIQYVWLGGEPAIYSILGDNLGNFVEQAIIFSGLFLAFPFGLFSLITGLVALFLSKEKVLWMAVVGVVLGVIGIALGIFWWYLFLLFG